MPAVADLIHELSTTTGTGNLTLSGVNGKQSFDDGFGTGGTNVFYYFISNAAAAEYEWGTGHLSAADTLVRDTVLGGTNGTSLVSFTGGIKDVVNDIPAALQARNIHVGTTAPATPVSGQMWFDTTVGALYVYVNDGDSSQWMEPGYGSTTVVAASDTNAGIIETAIQSEMETATDVVRAVVPGRVHYHPAVPKAWVSFNGTGTPAIRGSHNVSSITDTNTGRWSVNFTTSFSSTNYGATLGAGTAGGSTDLVYAMNGSSPKTAGAVALCYVTSGGGVFTDVEQFDLTALGDQ